MENVHDIAKGTAKSLRKAARGVERIAAILADEPHPRSIYTYGGDPDPMDGTRTTNPDGTRVPCDEPDECPMHRLGHLWIQREGGRVCTNCGVWEPSTDTPADVVEALVRASYEFSWANMHEVVHKYEILRSAVWELSWWICQDGQTNGTAARLEAIYDIARAVESMQEDGPIERPLFDEGYGI